jgi:surface polysaccharide O-acyltransferase-like enzyme
MDIQAERPAQTRAHLYYFDFLRVFGVLCVVFMHAAAGPLRVTLGTAGWQLTNICTSLAFTAVPLYLMMSGYLAMTSPKTGDYGYILKKRLPRLVCTLAVWTLAAAVWLGRKGGPPAVGALLLSALQKPVMVHFWYMYTLIALTLISPFLYYGLNSLDEKGAAVVAVMAALVLIQTNLSGILGKKWQLDILVQLRLFGGSLSAYFLGWLLGRMKRRLPNWALLAAAAADLAFIACETAKYSAAAGRYNSVFQSQSGGFTVLLAACIFLLFKQNFNSDGALRRAAAPLAELSLGVYLCHNILMSMLDGFGFMGTRFLFTCGKTAVVTIAAALLIKTLASVKPLCYCCTGLRFDEACRTCSWQYTFRRISGRL